MNKNPTPDYPKIFIYSAVFFPVFWVVLSALLWQIIDPDSLEGFGGLVIIGCSFLGALIITGIFITISIKHPQKWGADITDYSEKSRFAKRKFDREQERLFFYAMAIPVIGMTCGTLLFLFELIGKPQGLTTAEYFQAGTMIGILVCCGMFAFVGLKNIMAFGFGKGTPSKLNQFDKTLLWLAGILFLFFTILLLATAVL